MKHMNQNLLNLHLGLRPSRPWLAALSLAVLVAACGGGGDQTAGVNTGGTGSSYTGGRVSGFGSVIVNGVRFDDSSASVSDDDGTGLSRSDVKLGMVVGVQAGGLSDDLSTGLATGTASAIQLISELKGPVSAKGASSLVVLGQTVEVTAATVFDSFASGLASVAVGNELEVYALFDPASNRFVATRIERKTGLTLYKLSGTVSALDATNQRFVLGGQLISYAGLSGTQLTALSNGLPVRVKLQTTQQSGAWVATQVRGATASISNQTVAELEGIVSDFVSLSNFKVNGVGVNASGTTVVFEDGSAASVANGQRIEVKGTVQAGVLVASRVEIKPAAVEIRLIGNVEAADTANQRFTLKGQTVVYDANTRFDDGTAASLAPSMSLEVRGALSASGTQILASRIKFGP